MSTTTNSKRLVLITNLPTPYRIPFFNELANGLRMLNWQLIIIFGGRGESRRQWQIDLNELEPEYYVLNGGYWQFQGAESVAFHYPKLIGLLKELAPELIITSGFSFATMKVWLLSLFSGKPYLIWTGAIANEQRKVSWLREVLRKCLVRTAEGCVVYGSAAERYARALGSRCTYVAINTVDVNYFSKECRQLRQTLARKECFHFLYIGHLMQRKRLDLLFKSIACLVRQRTDFVLDIIGAGPEQVALIVLAEQLGISAQIRFHGFKQKSELPHYLAQADCFVFPSEYDIWGLVLVEAMAAGLPCLASSRAGATEDLIIDGVNGFSLDFENIDAVTEKLHYLLEHPEIAAAMGKASLELVETKLSLQQSAAGVLAAVTALEKDVAAA